MKLAYTERIQNEKAFEQGRLKHWLLKPRIGAFLNHIGNIDRGKDMGNTHNNTKRLNELTGILRRNAKYRPSGPAPSFLNR